MRFSLITLMVLGSICLNSQDDIYFISSNWNNHSSQKYEIHTERNRFNGKGLADHSQAVSLVNIEVVDSTSGGYKLHWTTEEVKLEHPVYEAMASELLDQLKNLTIKFETDSLGQVVRLNNFDECQEFFEASSQFVLSMAEDAPEDKTAEKMEHMLSNFNANGQFLENSIMDRILVFTAMYGEVFRLNQPIEYEVSMPMVFSHGKVKALKTVEVTDYNEHFYTVKVNIRADDEELRKGIWTALDDINIDGKIKHAKKEYFEDLLLEDTYVYHVSLDDFWPMSISYSRNVKVGSYAKEQRTYITRTVTIDKPRSEIEYSYLIEEDQEDFSAYVYRGDYRNSLNKFQGAHEDFSMAINMAPDFMPAYFGRAHSLIGLGEFQKALDDVNVLLKRNALDKNALILRAEIFQLLGANEDAVRDYTLLLNLNPTDIQCIAAKGACLEKLLLFEDAENLYSDLIKQLPKSEKGYAMRGSLRLITREFEAAKSDFDKVLELVGPSALSHGLMGYYHLWMEDYSLAIDQFEKSLVYDPLYFPSLANRGYARIMLGDYEGGINDCEIVLANIPNYTSGYSNIGFAKYKQDKQDEALDYINTAIENDPTDAFAFRNRALVYLKMGDKEAACLDILKAEDLNFSIFYQGKSEALKMLNCSRVNN